MVKRSPLAAEPRPSDPSARPEVLVDFSVVDGLLSVQLNNVGGRSAYQVKTTFHRSFHGIERSKAIPAMRLFRKVEFMAPGKTLDHFIDSLAGYVRRKQPLQLVATVRYRDREGQRFEDRCAHDLGIYLELRDARIAGPTPQGE
jgi:hypothetical protein